jgi:hypothetical protein
MVVKVKSVEFIDAKYETVCSNNLKFQQRKIAEAYVNVHIVVSDDGLDLYGTVKMSVPTYYDNVKNLDEYIKQLYFA